MSTIGTSPQSADAADGVMVPQERGSGWRHVAFIALWLAGAVAFVLSGPLALLLLFLTPKSGADVLVLVMKGVLVAGWLAIGFWQIRMLFERRWRFLLAPFAGWIWVYGVGIVLASSAFLNWGD